MAVVVAIAALLSVGFLLISTVRGLDDVRVRSRDGHLEASTVVDATVIITHLRAESSGRTVIAELSPPVVILEGGARRLPPLDKLVWKDWSGSVAAPPTEMASVKALYTKPRISR